MNDDMAALLAKVAAITREKHQQANQYDLAIGRVWTEILKIREACSHSEWVEKPRGWGSARYCANCDMEHPDDYDDGPGC